MKRKVLSMVLALAIAFTFMPFLPAGASYATTIDAENAIFTSAQLVKHINDNGGKSVYDDEEDAVKLTADFTTSMPLMFLNGTDTVITLDLNGHKIISTATEDANGAIWMEGAGELYVMDSDNDGAGLLFDKHLDGVISSKDTPCVYVENGTVSIMAVELNLDAEKEIDAVVVENGGSLVMASDYVYSNRGGVAAGPKTYITVLSSMFSTSTDPETTRPSIDVYGKLSEVTLLLNAIRVGNEKAVAVNVSGEKADVLLMQDVIEGPGTCIMATDGSVEVDGGKITTNDAESTNKYDVVRVFNKGFVSLGGEAKIKGTYGVACTAYTDEETAKVELERCTITNGGGELDPALVFPSKYALKDIIGEDYFIAGITDEDIKIGSETTIYKSPIKVYGKPLDIFLSSYKFVYDGKAHTPKYIDVMDTDFYEISSKYYTVSYNKSVRKAVGKYKITVKFKGIYEGQKPIYTYYKIVPKAPVIKSLTPGTKKLKVTANSKPSVKGGGSYQIAYRVKGTKTWKYTTTTASYKTIKNLKKGKVYQVKMRTFKTVNGVKYYSSWTKIKNTKKIK